MSLHADLSPEARERLHAQRRNSTISSIFIALLTVVLIALVLGVFLLPELVRETPTIVTYESNVVEETDVDVKKVSTSLDRKPSSPSSSMTKVIAANTTSPTAIPVPDVDVTTPSLDFGDGDDFGAGWGDGDGTGAGGGFGNIPTTMKKRCSKEDRLARLNETGGTPECEDAVVKALNWLKATQSANGSWPGGHYSSDSRRGVDNPAAMTGFAILAYLGHCETPVSPDYGDTVLRGITYLVDLGMKPGGRLTTNPAEKTWVYEHAIATYALAEASTFCKQGNINVPNLFEVTQKAGQIIIDNQHKRTGGWAYSFDTSDGGHRDLSISAWCIQALKACHHTGLEFKGLTRATNKAMSFVDSMKCRDGGFAYKAANESPNAAGQYHSMTGGGVLSLQMFDKGNQSGARSGLKYIRKNTKLDYDTGLCDLYGHYYEAQAMMNSGGEDWKAYNTLFRDEILKNQNPDGSWKAPNKGSDKGVRAPVPAYIGNVHYRTCLCTLMLEVYYRFLPGTGAKTR